MSGDEGGVNFVTVIGPRNSFSPHKSCLIIAMQRMICVHYIYKFRWK